MQKSEPPFFTELNVAILGLGLMGGSLALALKGNCGAVLGFDPDPAAVDLAVERGVADEVSSNLEDILPRAGIIILAAPVRAIIALLDRIPANHPAPAVVIDLGSTKFEITRAMALLPERFDPLGGHPICGKEKSSLAYAEKDLYQGAPFVFTTLPRTSLRARDIAVQIAQAAGAHPVWMDADEHDQCLAVTSHLPYIVSNALAAYTPLECASLTGPGFDSMTRLAVSSPEMMRDILITNRQNILSAMRAYKDRMARMEELLAAGDIDALSVLLCEGAENLERIKSLKGAGL